MAVPFDPADPNKIDNLGTPNLLSPLQRLFSRHRKRPQPFSGYRPVTIRRGIEIYKQNFYRIWNSGKSLKWKKARIFELWDDLHEKRGINDRRPIALKGEIIRRLIVKLINKHRIRYSPTELAKFNGNGTRTSLQRFNPYACVIPPYSSLYPRKVLTMRQIRLNLKVLVRTVLENPAVKRYIAKGKEDGGTVKVSAKLLLNLAGKSIKPSHLAMFERYLIAANKDPQVKIINWQKERKRINIKIARLVRNRAISSILGRISQYKTSGSLIVRRSDVSSIIKARLLRLIINGNGTGLTQTLKLLSRVHFKATEDRFSNAIRNCKDPWERIHLSSALQELRKLVIKARLYLAVDLGNAAIVLNGLKYLQEKNVRPLLNVLDSFEHLQNRNRLRILIGKTLEALKGPIQTIKAIQGLQKLLKILERSRNSHAPRDTEAIKGLLVFIRAFQNAREKMAVLKILEVLKILMDNLKLAQISKAPIRLRLKLLMKKESFRLLIKKLAQKSATERDVALESIKDTVPDLAKIASENGNQKEFLREAVITLGNLRNVSAIPFLKSIILTDDINFLENLAIIALGEKKTTKILIKTLRALRYRVNYRVSKSIISRGIRSLAIIKNPKERKIAQNILKFILGLEYSKRGKAIKSFLEFFTAITNPNERIAFETLLKHRALTDKRFWRQLKNSTPALRRAATDIGATLKLNGAAVLSELKKIIRALYPSLKLHSNRNSWLLIQKLAIVAGRKISVRALSTALRLLYQLDKASLKLLLKNNLKDLRYLNGLKPKERKAIAIILKILTSLDLTKRVRSVQIIKKFIKALKNPKTKEVFQVLAKIMTINDPREGFWPQIKKAAWNLVNIISKKWTKKQLFQEINIDSISEKISLVESIMLKDRETWLSIKKIAIAALGRIGNENIRNNAILPFLVRVVKDPSLSLVALGTIIQLQKEVLKPENIKDLKNLLVEKILYSDDFEARRTATLMLGALNDRRAIPGLVQMLSNYIKLDDTSSKLVKADPSIITEFPLLQVIYNRTAGIKAHLFAIRFLMRLRDNRAIKPLMILAKTEPKLRPPIFLALKRIINSSSLPIISKLLNNKDAFIRRFTVTIIGFKTDEVVVLPLLKKLAKKLYDGMVPRQKILKIFGRRDLSWKRFFANPNEKHLIFMPDAAALIKSARINENKRKKLLAIFHRTLKSDPIVIKSAIIALTRLSKLPALNNDFFANALIEKYKTPTTIYNNRVLILRALGTVGSGVALPVLLSALKSRDNQIQEAAIFALGMLGMQRIKKDLIVKKLVAKYKSSNNDKTKLIILQALSVIGSKVALPFLLSLINNPNHKIRNAVIFILGKLGDAKVLQIFRKRFLALNNQSRQNKPKRDLLSLRPRLYLTDKELGQSLKRSREIKYLNVAIQLLQKRLRINGLTRLAGDERK